MSWYNENPNEDDLDPLVPREKCKNEDQEWWKSYYKLIGKHHRNNSTDTTNSNSTYTSTEAPSEDFDDSFESRDDKHISVSAFPLPPRTNVMRMQRKMTVRTRTRRNKPLPPVPVKAAMSEEKEIVRRRERIKVDMGKGRVEHGRKVSSGSSVPSVRIDFDKPLPSTPLKPFQSTLGFQDGWVDEKWISDDKEGWL